jgi:hypothetical protein
MPAEMHLEIHPLSLAFIVARYAFLVVLWRAS